MKNAIRYRGRDGEDCFVQSGKVRLFHSRLSIIDLDGGAQPLTDGSGRFTIVFNGEIYNYKELRAEYEAAGARFKTCSDTEVILEGYKLKGERVCHDLNGMFAFAIWDAEAGDLFLARDRLGKKPLVWTEIGETFYFASTTDAFRAIPGWSGKLSLLYLDWYSAVGAVPIGKTAFRQAFSLPPGSHARVTAANRIPRPTVYWRFDFSGKRSIGMAAALDELEALLVDAIDIRLRADVPLCLTFSGGVDSGLIAALASKQLNRRLSCWTIDYHTSEDPSDETVIAEQVAKLLGLDWHHEHFDYHADLFPMLREALKPVDQPCQHIAISYSRRLYDVIRRHATVCLSGNGADEIFLGYAGNEDLVARDRVRHRPPLARMLGAMLPTRLASRLGVASPIPLADYQAAYVAANLVRRPDEPEPEELLAELRGEIAAAGVESHADLYTWMGLRYYTCDANFRLPDIAGMAAQIEVRSPFLDYRVVEFAAKLPNELKSDGLDPGSNKMILKQLYERYVPKEIAWAKKKGMGSNLRYDRSLATDPELHRLYARQLDRMAAHGIDSERYRRTWQTYIDEKNAGVRYPAGAGQMMAGLMLGFWLERNEGLADVR